MINRFIQKLTIENFKSIRKLQDFELRNINILIGANGSGKSNFLSFFSLVRNLIEKNLNGYVAKKGKADGILTFGRKNNEYLSADITFKTNSYGFKLQSTEDNRFYFDDEYSVYYKGGNRNSWHGGGIYKGYNESVLEDKKANYIHAKYFAHQFKKILQYHFHDTGESSPIKSDCDVNVNQKLEFDGSNIAAFIRRLYFDYRDSYDLIVNTIRLVVPDFYAFDIREQVKSGEIISLYWVNKNDRQPKHPMFLSDGSLRFICLATVLLQPLELMPDIIIIDEPELGLHPQALSIVADLIERVSLQKQFVIATQSSSLVDMFEPEDIIVVDKNLDGTSLFKRQNRKDLTAWLNDYNMSDLWNMNLIGGRP